MSLARIRDEYRIPARIGARVVVLSPNEHAWAATIVGSHEDFIRVQDDHHKSWLVSVDDITFI